MGTRPLLLAVLSFITFGCSTGVMTVRQIHYLAVPSGDNVNYFRIRVRARTHLGKAEFRSGWYPSEAVESLFGDVSQEGSIQTLKTREDIKAQINVHLIAATEAYLDAAADPSTDPEKLKQLLEARRQVRLAPSPSGPLPGGVVEMEYDPESGLVVTHAGDKLVFVLSSDPDEVIGVIANFAEQQKTSLEVTKLADVFRKQAIGEVTTREAVNEARARRDQLVHAQIQSALAVVSAPNASRDDALREIEILRALIGSVE